MIDLLKEFLTHERNRHLRTCAVVLLMLALGAFVTKYLAGRLIPTQTRITEVTTRP
jgi:hypothetical protein